MSSHADVLERYAGLLAASIEAKSGIEPEEAARLQYFRERHGIGVTEHEAALDRVSSSPAEWDRLVELGEEVSTYLHVVAATRLQPDGEGDQVLAIYRERHGISDAVHAAAMQVLGLPCPPPVAAPPSADDELSTAVMATYRKMVSQAMDDEVRDDELQNLSSATQGLLAEGEVVTPESTELKLFEFGAAHGVSAAFHDAAVRALGTDRSSLDELRKQRLERRLVVLEGKLSDKKAEIRGLEAALQASEEGQTTTAIMGMWRAADDEQAAGSNAALDGAAYGAALTASVSKQVVAPAAELEGDELLTPRTALADAGLQVTALERSLGEAEEEGGRLKARMEASRSRMGAIQQLLDAREAEVYETEEAMREMEAKRTNRTRERRALLQQVKQVEALIGAKQRELVHLAALPDGVTPSTISRAARWVGAEWSALDDGSDPDVEARTLRQIAKGRGGGGGSADAGYVEFHTVCMGVKLAMSAHPRLKNVRIDELWDEARRRTLPRSEWHAFARERLLDVPSDAAGGWVGSLGLAVGGLRDDVRSAVKNAGRNWMDAISGSGPHADK